MSLSTTHTAPAGPTGASSNTHISSPLISFTCGTRSRIAAGARDVQRSHGSLRCVSESTTSRPDFSITDLDIPLPRSDPFTRYDRYGRPAVGRSGAFSNFNLKLGSWPP